ncbi:hypothetical protein DRJ16_04490 [Candidatus Woesearchaeota archaeon]|nr:MAG: hypothetical protein DRJ16_04490 [Candidatus Woesearchaeota archaeon]
MNILNILSKEKEKLQGFDKTGKVYIPKEIRKKFSENVVFYVMYENGRIILTPLDKLLKN